MKNCKLIGTHIEKSSHFQIWIFLKFEVCEILRKIQIIFVKLKFKSLENLDCAKCFADFQNQEFAKYFKKFRSFLQSHILNVFKRRSLQNILQNPDLFAKLKSKPLQNLDFAKHFTNSRCFTFCILDISQNPVGHTCISTH